MRRVIALLEDFMQRNVDRLLEAMRPEARRVQRELSELQVRYGELNDEFQRFRLQLGQTGRITRRLDRAVSLLENVGARDDEAYASGYWGYYS